MDEKIVNFHLSEKSTATRPAEITSEEKKLLYCEIIYTIKHKIGTTMIGHHDFTSDLYRYAQSAFGLSVDDHNRLFSLISEEKVSF